jgi:phospholipid transport system transporter-binding protein
MNPAVDAAANAIDRTALELIEDSPCKFTARGPLTFATAKAGRDAGLRVFGPADCTKTLEVDCSGITHSDSAGMTVLLDWLAFAKHAGRKMHFTNLPQQVQAIARISDALELLEAGV